jgi:predicted dehydrogenase
MKPVRIAIIGAGHLGKIHTKLACANPALEVVAIVDPLLSGAKQLAREYGVKAFATHTEVASDIEAALLATPTNTHYEIAADLLARGKHLFVEKPITLNAADAADLIDLAEKQGCILQVGHVERFNPAFLAARNVVQDVRHFESVRKGTYTFRSTDVSVVLDLMIHDLDLVLSQTSAPVVHVAASGAVVMGPNEDWAEARVTFADGSTATFSASRVHTQAERTMQIVGTNGSAFLDFQTKQATLLEFNSELGSVNVNRLSPTERTAYQTRMHSELLVKRTLPVVENNALAEEQREFASAIRGVGSVTVSGTAGHAAVLLAEQIMAEIAANREIAARSQKSRALQRERAQWETPVRKAG